MKIFHTSYASHRTSYTEIICCNIVVGLLKGGPKREKGDVAELCRVSVVAAAAGCIALC